jgi:hypothetical protein
MKIKVLGLSHVRSILTEETIRKNLLEESINAQTSDCADLVILSTSRFRQCGDRLRLSLSGKP